MSYRQQDTWTLDLYLNEAGWDGTHEYFYFLTQRDAKAVGEEMESRVKNLGGDYRLSWTVYKIAPWESFMQFPNLRRLAIEGVWNAINPEDS